MTTTPGFGFMDTLGRLTSPEADERFARGQMEQAAVSLRNAYRAAGGNANDPRVCRLAGELFERAIKWVDAHDAAGVTPGSP